MDCEKVESMLLSELYGELDEITSAAVKRHVAGCARCTALLGGLRATRRVAALPTVEVPAGLEGRILAAAAAHAPAGTALQWRVARAVSMAGNWAMRPQTAMAAVFMVMIGTSVLLLRGRSSRAPASAEMIVTEEGTPAPSVSGAPTSADPRPATPALSASAAPMEGSEGEKSERSAAPVFAAAPAAPAAPVLVAAAPAPASEPAAEARLRAPKAATRMLDDDSIEDTAGPSRGLAGGRGAGVATAPMGAARSPFAQAPAAPAPFDADAELGKARAERDDAARRGQPCPSVARFNDVVNRAGGTSAGWDAVYEGALCYESMGDYASARNRLNVLLRVDPYRDRARAQLDQLNRAQQASPGSQNAASKPSPADQVPAAGAP